MPDNQRIQEIKERCKKATPGPWEVHWYNGCGVVNRVSNEKVEPLCECSSIHAEDSNREFIANSREDIPFLLKKISKLESLNEKYKKALEFGVADPVDLKRLKDNLEFVTKEELFVGIAQMDVVARKALKESL